MNQPVLLLIGSLLLTLGCGGDGDPTDPSGDPTGPRLVLQPSELCSDNPASSIATFEGASLEMRVRVQLGISAADDLTCGLLSGLVRWPAAPGEITAWITSLVGIQNLTSLQILSLAADSITDISPLSGLTTMPFCRTRLAAVIIAGRYRLNSGSPCCNHLTNSAPVSRFPWPTASARRSTMARWR